MQKFSDPCIKTGNFAKLCGTNKRTLIHYDDIGIFKPAFTDERGYRYYSESQFDVFFTITCLRELGMPLKDIGEYLKQRSPESLKKLLSEQMKTVLREEQRLLKIKQVIKTKLSLLSEKEKLEGRDPYMVTLESMPEEYLILSDYLNTNDHQSIIRTLCSHVGYCNAHNLNSGHPYGAMLDVKELRKGDLDTYAYFFTKVIEKPKEQLCHIKPAGVYAVVYLKGNYYNAAETYERLFQWLDEHGLKTGKYSYKEAVIDELASDSEKEYLTKISVLVKE